MATSIEEEVKREAAQYLNLSLDDSSPSLSPLYGTDRAHLLATVIDAFTGASDHIQASLRRVLRSLIPKDSEGVLMGRIEALLAGDSRAQWLNGYSYLADALDKIGEVNWPAARAKALSCIGRMGLHAGLLDQDATRTGSKILALILRVVQHVYCGHQVAIWDLTGQVNFWVETTCTVIENCIHGNHDNGDKLLGWAVSTLNALVMRYSRSKPTPMLEGPSVERVVMLLLMVRDQCSHGNVIDLGISQLVLHSSLSLMTCPAFGNIMDVHVSKVIKDVVYPSLLDRNKDSYEGTEVTELLLQRCFQSHPKTVANFLAKLITSAESSPLEQSTAILVVGTLLDKFQEMWEIILDIEQVIDDHLMPIDRFPEGFRRAQIYWLVEKLVSKQFPWKYLDGKLINQTIKSITEDQDLSVRMMASAALRRFFMTNNKVAKQSIIDNIHSLVTVLVQLAPSNKLYDTFECIHPISLYLKHGTPVETNQIPLQLCYLFNSLLANQIETHQMLPEVRSVYRDLHVGVKSFRLIYPEIQSTFYDMLATVLEQTVGPRTLFTVPFRRLLRKASEYGEQGVANLLSSIDGHVNPNRFLKCTDPKKLETFKTVSMDILSRPLNCKGDIGLRAQTVQMIELVLACFEGAFDDCIPQFINCMVDADKDRSRYGFHVSNYMKIIASVLTNSPKVTLDVLQTQTWPGTGASVTDMVLQLLVTNSYRFPLDQELYAMAVGRIMSLPEHEQPPYATTSKHLIIQSVIKVINQ